MKKILAFACVALFAGSLMAQGGPQEQSQMRKENRKTEQSDKRDAGNHDKMMKNKGHKHSKKCDKSCDKKGKMMDKKEKMMDKKRMNQEGQQ